MSDNTAWYVRYTVRRMHDEPAVQCTAGPYSWDEVTDALRDLQNGGGITHCYVTNEPQ